MGITFGDYLIDGGHYDPPEEETMAIPLEAMGDAGTSGEPAVSNKDAIARLILRAMHQAWDAETYGELRAEEANRNIAATTANAINFLNRGLIQKIEAEARRYAEMYPQSSDGRNTFVIFADWVASHGQ